MKQNSVFHAKKSAGILLYRFHNNMPEVLLVHSGGFLRAKKDLGAWYIPKGEFEPDETPLDAAKREIEEETGIKVHGAFIELTPVKQKSGKVIYAWAMDEAKKKIIERPVPLIKELETKLDAVK